MCIRDRLDSPKPAAFSENGTRKRRLLSLFKSSTSIEHEEEVREDNEDNKVHENKTTRSRSLLAINPRNKLPTTHKISVERECIQNLIKLKILRKGG